MFVLILLILSCVSTDILKTKGQSQHVQVARNQELQKTNQALSKLLAGLTSGTTTKEPITTTTTEDDPGETTCPEVSSQEVYYPDPKDCGSFYLCSNGVPYHHSCDDGLYFNPNINVCDSADNVECNANPNGEKTAVVESLTLKLQNFGNVLTWTGNSSDTIQSVKEFAHNQVGSAGKEVSNVRLVFGGKELEANRQLSDYMTSEGLKSGDTIFVINRFERADEETALAVRGVPSYFNQYDIYAPECKACTCQYFDKGYDGYANCDPITAKTPCETNCVQCERNGHSPMPGPAEKHEEECGLYKVAMEKKFMVIDSGLCTDDPLCQYIWNWDYCQEAYHSNNKDFPDRLGVVSDFDGEYEVSSETPACFYQNNGALRINTARKAEWDSNKKTEASWPNCNPGTKCICQCQYKWKI